MRVPRRNISDAAYTPPSYLPPGLIRRCVVGNRLRARTTVPPAKREISRIPIEIAPVVTRNPGRGRFFSAAERSRILFLVLTGCKLRTCVTPHVHLSTKAKTRNDTDNYCLLEKLLFINDFYEEVVRETDQTLESPENILTRKRKV